jgi:iron complex transport system substrate-binding protein
MSKSLSFKLCCFLLLSITHNSGIAKNRLIIRETPTSVTIKNADNTEVTIKKQPKKVIIAYSSYVGLWYCAGGTAIGVPMTKSKKIYPDAALNVTRIGSFANPSMEKIIALQPDLVLLNFNVSSHRRMIPLLRENNIRSIIIKYDNYGDFKQLLELFCSINGTKLKDNPVATNIIESVTRIITRPPPKTPLRFLSLFSSGRGVAVEDSTTNTAYMATLLGGVNVVDSTNIKGKRIRFSLEKIVIDDPDIIFVTTMGNSKKLREKMYKEFMSSRIWKTLSAVKNRQVYFLDNDLFLFKANLRYPLAFNKLAAIMYPPTLTKQVQQLKQP